MNYLSHDLNNMEVRLADLYNRCKPQSMVNVWLSENDLDLLLKLTRKAIPEEAEHDQDGFFCPVFTNGLESEYIKITHGSIHSYLKYPYCPHCGKRLKPYTDEEVEKL